MDQSTIRNTHPHGPQAAVTPEQARHLISIHLPPRNLNCPTVKKESSKPIHSVTWNPSRFVRRLPPPRVLRLSSRFSRFSLVTTAQATPYPRGHPKYEPASAGGHVDLTTKRPLSSFGVSFCLLTRGPPAAWLQPQHQQQQQRHHIHHASRTLHRRHYYYYYQHYQRRGMRIATLQFSPRMGDVAGNMRRADELLKRGKKKEEEEEEDGDGIEELRPEILVLPELAFTGEFFEFEIFKCLYVSSFVYICKKWHKIIEMKKPTDRLLPTYLQATTSPPGKPSRPTSSPWARVQRHTGPGRRPGASSVKSASDTRRLRERRRRRRQRTHRPGPGPETDASTRSSSWTRRGGSCSTTGSGFSTTRTRRGRPRATWRGSTRFVLGMGMSHHGLYHHHHLAMIMTTIPPPSRRTDRQPNTSPPPSASAWTSTPTASRRPSRRGSSPAACSTRGRSSSSSPWRGSRCWGRRSSRRSRPAAGRTWTPSSTGSGGSGRWWRSAWDMRGISTTMSMMSMSLMERMARRGRCIVRRGWSSSSRTAPARRRPSRKISRPRGTRGRAPSSPSRSGCRVGSAGAEAEVEGWKMLSRTRASTCRSSAGI
ncbi:hypothetical protein VTN02DRAFT_2806 [Thermoascus thermophilus]